MVALDLNIDIRQSGVPRKREKFPADERIKTSCTESCHNFFKRSLHGGVFRVVPQKLAIQVLQQNGASRLADSRHFRHGLLLFLQVLQQHAAVHQIEAVGRELHRLGISANKFHARILAILLPRLPQTVLAHVYTRCPNRRIQIRHRAQNDARAPPH